MHAHTIDDFRHEHVFLGAHHDRNERKTWIVVAICGATDGDRDSSAGRSSTPWP